jgi:hypothetical protein
MSRFFPYRNAAQTPSVMNPTGGNKSTTTPLLMALCPSAEVAFAVL